MRKKPYKEKRGDTGSDRKKTRKLQKVREKRKRYGGYVERAKRVGETGGEE